MKQLDVKTGEKEELIDITANISKVIDIDTGVCFVYCPHTTAGLTVNEGADPAVKNDIIDGLKRIVPEEIHYQHREGNSPAHIKASLMGNSATIFVEGGRLQLGTWGALFLCEFDGPRNRRVFVRLIKG
jgi:secondary thiamine-phosphate synthase enzyme